MTTYTATYEPDDNKLRLYASSRLDAEAYASVKAAGFRWAPKQDLFFTTWSPTAEDLAIELAGELEDEDKSLVDRAEERAERFQEYRENRTADAESAHKAVAAIADNIPFGQPILCGHHSERHARKDAERIENGMRKAVKAWETAEYWKYRAAGALRHAKYKELPSVRARRIKTLEAALRKEQKTSKEAAAYLRLWSDLSLVSRKDGTAMTDHERAKALSNYDHTSQCFPLADYPRDPPASQYEGPMGLWSALDGNVITAEQAREIAVPAHERTIARCARWITHYENRLTYERAMLEDQGATDLLAPKPKPKLPPLLNYRGENGVIIAANRFTRGKLDTLRQVDMTAAEYARKPTDYKGTATVEGSHRVRVAMIERHERVAVFITDTKTHEKPAPASTPAKTGERELHAPVFVPREPEKPSANAATFAAMKETLRAGIKTVSSPDLFATPPALAKRVIAAADIRPGHRVLEPSAGTGALLSAIPPGTDIVAVEINHELADFCRKSDTRNLVFTADFLTDCGQDETASQIVLGTFDRIVMNPPFSDRQDIKHVTHALKFLRPGGKIVAIMSAGVTFREDRLTREFREMVESHNGTIEALPADSFKSAGTGVNTVMVTISAPCS